MIEAPLDVRIQHVVVLFRDSQVDRFDCIVAGASRSEPVAVRLESRFPLWFEGELGEGLVCSVKHDRDIDSTLPHLPRRLRDLSPSPTRITHCAVSACGSSVSAAALTLIVRLPNGLHAAVAMSWTDYAALPALDTPSATTHLLDIDGLRRAADLIARLRPAGQTSTREGGLPS